MESLRNSLAPVILKRIEKELGRETTLRLLWPHAVGQKLAENIRLKAIRGRTLIVGVPDRSWLALGDQEQIVLDAVNRLGCETKYGAIEFVVDFAEKPWTTTPSQTETVGTVARGNRASASEPRAAILEAEGLRQLTHKRDTKRFVVQRDRQR